MIDAAKRAVFESALGFGSVMIALDARMPGVVVPAKHAEDPSLQLRFGLNLKPNIPLDIDALGISAVLAFNGQPYSCRIPWTAVYAIKAELEYPFMFVCAHGQGTHPDPEPAPTPKPRAKLSLVPEAS